MKRNISLQQLIDELDTTSKQCKNLSPLLNRVEDIAHNATMENFAREQDSFGNKWQKLSAQTLQTKRGSTILRDSGTLQSSINSRSKVFGSKDNPKGSVSIGTNLEYGAIHHFGGKAGRGQGVDIPARPFLPFKEDKLPEYLKEDIRNAIIQHFKFGVD